MKTIFKKRLILIDSRAGQSEDCTRPRSSWGLKQLASILLILVFILLVLIHDRFCSFNVSNESFLNA